MELNPVDQSETISYEQKPGAIAKARKEIKKRTISYMTAGLGLVAGLAWNDAIKAAIDYLIPNTGNTVIAKLVSALAITAIVGLFLLYAEKVLDKE